LNGELYKDEEYLSSENPRNLIVRSLEIDSLCATQVGICLAITNWAAAGKYVLPCNLPN
jgi:hypothetical protein